MAKKTQTKIKNFTLLFRHILHSVRVPFWLLEGDELNSQSPLTILCSANELDRNYLASLSFGKEHKETELGIHWIWNAARLSKRHAPRCGLIMIQAHPKLRKLFFSNRWFFIPVWFQAQVKLSNPISFPHTRSLKIDLKRVRNAKWGYEVTQDLQKLDDFYQNMHLPTMQQSHDKSAICMTYEELNHYADSWELLLIMQGEQSIAGQLIAQTAQGKELWYLGVRNADPEYRKLGIIGALYQFSFEYLASQNISSVSLGRCRAFLSDGLFQYKLKWGMQIKSMLTLRFAMKIQNKTDATISFLQHNPFVFDEGEGPYAASFFEEGKVPERDKTKVDRLYRYPSIKKAYVYPLPNSDKTDPFHTQRIFIPPMN